MVQVNKHILRDEIEWLLEAINEQYHVIMEYELKVPQIEFDIILENVRKLYQDFHLLQQGDDLNDLIGKKSGEQVLKHITEGSPELTESGEKIKGPKIERKAQERKTKEIDLFSEESSGFTQKLKEAREKTLGLKMKGERSGDLKSAITINEKFLFINELFDGNLRDYNEAVETLTKCPDKDTASGFLDQMRRSNRWGSESEAFKKLNELVMKRFE